MRRGLDEHGVHPLLGGTGHGLPVGHHHVVEGGREPVEVGSIVVDHEHDRVAQAEGRAVLEVHLELALQAGQVEPAHFLDGGEGIVGLGFQDAGELSQVLVEELLRMLCACSSAFLSDLSQVSSLAR